MSRRAAAWLGWGFCLLSVTLLASAFAFDALSSPASTGAEPESEISTLAAVAFVLAFAVVGALVASRRPANPIGWMMSVAGLAYAVGGASIIYVESLEPSGPQPGAFGATLALWVTTWVWIIGLGPVFTFVLLLFPSGRLPSRRWRPVAWAAGSSLALLLVGLALTPGRFEGDDGTTGVENPVGVPGADAVAAIGLMALAASALASVASLIFRYRAAKHGERQQLKWLTYAAALIGLVVASTVLAEIVGGLSEDLSNTLVSGSITAVPVTMGIAILRHGLYDVDLVINRTLVYGALTAALALAYLGSVLVLGQALQPLTQDSDLAIAGSTLGVAALFRPARARIQAAVDRRFYRRKYDAARTLEAFSARLRDELDLDALGDELRAAVRDTMQPAHVSLWLRVPEARR